MKVQFHEYQAGANLASLIPGYRSFRDPEDDENVESNAEADLTATQFKQWLRQVAQEAWGVGGDDSFYDYYPDNFYVAHQIAKQFKSNLRSHVEWAEDFAIAVRYSYSGMGDGLNIQPHAGHLDRFSEIMGRLEFVKAHEFSDQMAIMGGYWMGIHTTKSQWTISKKMQELNDLWVQGGGDKDLVPYPERVIRSMKEQEAAE